MKRKLDIYEQMVLERKRKIAQPVWDKKRELQKKYEEKHRN